MPKVRDVPTEMEMALFDRGFLDNLAWCDLPGLQWQDGRRNGASRRFGKGGSNLLFDFAGIDVAHNDEKRIVRRILLGVVGDEVLPLDLVENIRVANDSEPIRASRVGGFEQPARRTLP